MQTMQSSHELRNEQSRTTMPRQVMLTERRHLMVTSLRRATTLRCGVCHAVHVLYKAHIVHTSYSVRRPYSGECDIIRVRRRGVRRESKTWRGATIRVRQDWLLWRRVGRR